MAPGTTKQDAEPTRRSKPGVIEWLQTVPGIVTSVAGLLAAAGAFYGGAQLSTGGTPRPGVTVTVQAPGRTVTVPGQAVTVTEAAGPSTQVAPTPTVGSTALPPGAAHLSARASHRPRT